MEGTESMKSPGGATVSATTVKTTGATAATTEVTTTGAIILAAGSSQRFGSHKLLAKLDNGETMFAQTLNNIRTAIPHVLVITRPELVDALRSAQCSTRNSTPHEADVHGNTHNNTRNNTRKNSLNILTFNDAEQGMGASLAFAATQLPAWDAVLVCLADMPFISSATYKAIAERATASNIVVPEFGGKHGNPVAFGAQFFPALAGLSGDGGGRRLWQTRTEAVLAVPVDDPGVLLDIDTPEQLAAASAQNPA